MIEANALAVAASAEPVRDLDITTAIEARVGTTGTADLDAEVRTAMAQAERIVAMADVVITVTASIGVDVPATTGPTHIVEVGGGLLTATVGGPTMAREGTVTVAARTIAAVTARTIVVVTIGVENMAMVGRIIAGTTITIPTGLGTATAIAAVCGSRFLA